VQFPGPLSLSLRAMAEAPNKTKGEHSPAPISGAGDSGMVTWPKAWLCSLGRPKRPSGMLHALLSLPVVFLKASTVEGEQLGCPQLPSAAWLGLVCPAAVLCIPKRYTTHSIVSRAPVRPTCDGGQLSSASWPVPCCWQNLIVADSTPSHRATAQRLAALPSRGRGGGRIGGRACLGQPCLTPSSLACGSGDLRCCSRLWRAGCCWQCLQHQARSWH
jgi:hypothetical protein